MSQVRILPGVPSSIPGGVLLLRWILRLVLTLLAARLLARSMARRPAEPPPFDPGGGRNREKARRNRAPRTDDIADADYEELPQR